jgi:hypothetical protein
MMRTRLAVLAFALLLTAAFALAQAPAGNAPGSREEAIVATALDYSDGGYSGDAARMERALHPDLNKLFFMRRSPAMGLIAGYSTYSGLIEMTRMGALNLEAEKRRTEVAVLESTDDVACVRLKSSQWCDYLQMIKDKDRWKIVNVLWTAGLDAPPARRLVTGFDAEKERPAARAAAVDYLEGMLSGDAARLEKTLHPETNQIVVMTNAKSGAAIVNRTRYSGLLEPAKSKAVLAPENARQAEARVLDLMDGMAFAAAQTARGAAYLQLQLLDGQWKVINVLVRPAQSAVPQAPPAKK